MKKKTLQKNFTEIMDLSAEISMQISVSNLLDPYSCHNMDTMAYVKQVEGLLKAIDEIAAEINYIAYKNIK